MKTLTGVLSAVMLLAGNAQAADKAPAAEPEFKTVTVEGEQFTVSGDLHCQDAKRKLIDYLRRKAVEQVVGTYVTSMSESQNFTILQDVVMAATTGYVRSEKLSSEECGDESFKATLTAEVGKGQIDKDAAGIASLIALKKQRRIYVLVNDNSLESVGGTKSAPGTVVAIRHGAFDGMLREKLREDGFFTLDPNMVDGKLKVRGALSSISSPQEATEIGNAVGADLIIYGNVTVTSEDVDVPGFGVKQPHAKAVVSLTCVAPNGAEVIADDAFTWDLAFKELGTAAGHMMEFAAKRSIAGWTFNTSKEKDNPVVEVGLRQKIYRAWMKQQSGAGQRLVLTVTNVKEYKTLTVFKELLSSSVANVKGVSSSRLDNGTASLDVSYLGNSDGFAGDLDGKSVNGHAISVTKVTPNTVEISLK